MMKCKVVAAAASGLFLMIGSASGVHSTELLSEAKPFDECVAVQKATGEMLGIIPKVLREGDGYRAVRLPSRRNPGQWVEMICDREAGTLSIRDTGSASAGPAKTEDPSSSIPNAKVAPSLVEKKPFADCIATQDSTGEMLGLKPQIVQDDPDHRVIRFPSRRAAGKWTEMACDRQVGTLSIREVSE